MSAIELRRLGRVDYLPTVEAMQRYTAERGPDSPDQLWLCGMRRFSRKAWPARPSMCWRPATSR